MLFLLGIIFASFLYTAFASVTNHLLILLASFLDNLDFIHSVFFLYIFSSCSHCSLRAMAKRFRRADLWRMSSFVSIHEHIYGRMCIWKPYLYSTTTDKDSSRWKGKLVKFRLKNFRIQISLGIPERRNRLNFYEIINFLFLELINSITASEPVWLVFKKQKILWDVSSHSR